MKHRICSQKELAQINEEVEQEMLDAVAFADQSPWPDPAEVGRGIYAKPIDPEAGVSSAVVDLQLPELEPEPEVKKAGI